MSPIFVPINGGGVDSNPCFVLLLDWLPARVRELSLPCYFTQNWGGEEISTFPKDFRLKFENGSLILFSVLLTIRPSTPPGNK